MVYCSDSLWAMLINAGFSENIFRVDPIEHKESNRPCEHIMWEQLNRRMFSLVMVAIK